MERRIIEKSLQDESFRQRPLADPKAALEEIGTRLPSASPDSEGDELSDRELEEVAGGGTINGSWREYLGMPRCE